AHWSSAVGVRLWMRPASAESTGCKIRRVVSISGMVAVKGLILRPATDLTIDSACTATSRAPPRQSVGSASRASALATSTGTSLKPSATTDADVLLSGCTDELTQAVVR